MNVIKHNHGDVVILYDDLNELIIHDSTMCHYRGPNTLVGSTIDHSDISGSKADQDQFNRVCKSN